MITINIQSTTGSDFLKFSNEITFSGFLNEFPQHTSDTVVVMGQNGNALVLTGSFDYSGQQAGSWKDAPSSGTITGITELSHGDDPYATIEGLSIGFTNAWEFISNLAYIGFRIPQSSDTIVFNGNAGADAAAGGSGDDTLSGQAGDDTLTGGAGNDILFGDDGDDILSGAGAAWLATGPNDDNVIHGGRGNDRLLGAGGYDKLYGGQDQDNITGGRGDDMLAGQGGHDVLDGGKGRDTLKGGAGFDLLDGGEGKDLLAGGAGGDTFVISHVLTGVDTIRDFETGIDTVRVVASLFGDGLFSGVDLTDLRFEINTSGAASASQPSFVLDVETGALYYDRSGTESGATDSLLIARLAGDLTTFSQGDFEVVI